MKRLPHFLLVALLILGIGAPPARAATLSGRASTQAFWFADEFGSDHIDVAQYLRFAARQLDANDTLRLNGYGRAWGDTAIGGVQGRLYNLYLDKKEIVKGTNVRVGRQFFFVGAGAGIVDGARIDTRAVGPLAITVVGGRDVIFDTTGEATHGGDIAAAVQVGLTNIPDGAIDLSYYLKYDESDLARETYGLTANKRFGGIGELYTEIRFDAISEVFSEIQVGARTAIIPRLMLNAEFFRSIPVFDASSIFAVFAVDRFQEIVLRADYDLSALVALHGEYRNESYGGGDTANVGEAGVRYRPMDGTSIYGAAIWRVGTGGNLYGFELSADRVFLKKYTLAAGIQRDSFKRELMNDYDDATRFYVGGEARLLKNVSVAARVEDTISDQVSKDLRARLALNFDF
ncbi:MAG: hypothetical protein ACM3NF_00815 [Gemmatimonadota bacterium]